MRQTITIENVQYDCIYVVDDNQVYYASIKVGGFCIVENLKESFLDKLTDEIFRLERLESESNIYNEMDSISI